MIRPPPVAARHAFPPGARLHSPPEYQRAFAEGRRHHGRLFRLHHRSSDEATRLGVSVSKRVDKRAVARNRIKRLARETFRHLRACLEAGDYVLVARHEAAAASPDALRAELDWLLRKPASHAASLKPTAAAGTMADSAPAGASAKADVPTDPPADS